MRNKEIGALMFIGLGVANIAWVWGEIVINSLKAKQYKEVIIVHAFIVYIIIAIYFLCT